MRNQVKYSKGMHVRDEPHIDENHPWWIEGRIEFDDVCKSGKIAQPEDIVTDIIFLLSKKASYITGTLYTVDGAKHN